ncbi:MAG: amidase [Deltaproteobacteria bacterium]|nr:amidase [Deltaproteobacteria bacterium]
MTYQPRVVKAPRMAGGMLKLSAGLAESSLTGGLLAGTMLGSAGILEMRATPCDEALVLQPPRLPRQTPGGDAAPPVPDLAALEGLAPGPGFRFETARDFARAYREGRTSPLQVAERVLERTRESEERDPAMRLFIAQQRDDVLAQAHEATERWQHGKPLSALDGVPVAVKDEIDQRGYPTTVGTRFLGTAPAAEDAGSVAPLRRAGAVLIGKANMHEIGIGVTGLNPHHGAARNPYDPTRAPGGSSSGPAACVGAGLCPLAVGADGGGSIRIPASFCGVVGLKPTFGRVSERGAAPLCWSVAHIGPIAATVADAALGLAYMAGPDPRDPNTHGRPPVTLDGLGQADLHGVRVGVQPAWLEDADAAVVEQCRRGIDLLRAAGADVREIDLEDLQLVRAVHVTTIVTEMATAHLHHYAEHRKDYSLEVRLNLALARKLTATDYVHAQRLRARICGRVASVLAGVDVIAIPATGCTAPLLPRDALKSGESNLEVMERIMRFSTLANLTGLPAISVPAGYDTTGLPVGLQLLGRAFEEHLLLRLAAVVEQGVERRAPQVHYCLLPEAAS